MHRSTTSTPDPARRARTGRTWARALAVASIVTPGVACRPTEPAPPPEASPSAEVEPTPFAGVDLGFEDPALTGWRIDETGYEVTIDPTEPYEGKASLRLDHDGIHRGGEVVLAVPVEGARGRRLQVRVQVRTQGVDRDGVGLGLGVYRGDDTLIELDTDDDDRIRGDRSWTPLTLAIDVAEDADRVRLELQHQGEGSAWFDAIELSTEAIETPPPMRLEGRVVDRDGKPVPDALVGWFRDDGQHALARTDAEGSFSLAVEPGPSVVGVTSPHGVAHATDLAAVGPRERVELQLAAGEQRIGGIVDDGGGRPVEGATAIVTTDDRRTYAVRSGADGRWAVEIPEAVSFTVLVEDDGQRVFVPIHEPVTELRASVKRGVPAPAEARQWIADTLVPLQTVDPLAPLDDLAALDAELGQAVVVGLGEATHGTREFFRMKHRLLRYLVERHGYTVFAIEANRTECRAIDRYVRTGQGDPREALRGIYFWTWNTHEVLAMIEWMRAYNETHAEPLRFVGIDMQTPDVAARNVDAYLGRVEPASADREPVARIGRPWGARDFDRRKAAERRATLEALERLEQRFAERREAWSAATSAEQWADALEDVVLVRQALRMRVAQGMQGFAVRDQAMADNVLAIQRRYGPGTKIALWAHNGHVAREWSMTDVLGKVQVMGHHLGRALEDRYVAVGLAFDHGGFQAIEIRDGRFGGLREHRVGPARDGDLEAALREAGPPLFALSLRDRPTEGPVAKWLDAPIPMRAIGAGFRHDDAKARAFEVVPERFDLLVFIEQTTRARPVHRD